MNNTEYDYEPDSIADALAWVQRVSEEISTQQLSENQVEVLDNKEAE